MIQRKYLVFIGVLLLIALLWSAGWFWLAQKIEADITAFATGGNAEPIELSWDGIDVTGFPIRLNARLNNPRGVWPGPDRRIEWTGADTVIGFLTEGGRTVSFRAPGTHAIDIREGTEVFAIDSLVGELRGQIETGADGRMKALRGIAEEVSFRIDDKPSAEARSIAFDWTVLNGSATPDDIHPEEAGQTVAFVVRDVQIADNNLDASISGVLGTRIDQMAGSLSLRGAIAPGDINTGTLSRWRDDGGTLELENVDIAWGPLRITGEGTLAVDHALQPVGALTARIVGLDRLVDLLERTGEIRAQQAAVIRIALAVLTRAPANGGPAEARVPVSVQNRTLSIGPVRLMDLPPIRWD